MPENNIDKDAQEKIAALEKEIAKQKQIAENAETVLAKHSNEVGKVRAEREALEAELKAAKDKGEALEKSLESVKAEVVALKEQVAKVKVDQKPPAMEEVDKIETTLTEDEIKRVDAVYEAAPDDKKDLIEKDPVVRKEVLLAAKANKIEQRTWRKAPPKTENSEDIRKMVNELFKQAKQQSAFMPEGSIGAENRADGSRRLDDTNPRNKGGPVSESLGL